MEQGYLTQEQWNYISDKVLEMFRFGMVMADKANLILVDTKYEFGFDKNGVITTVAGSNGEGFSGDGGLATDAWLFNPRGVTVDDNGNIYISDSYNLE